MSDAELTAYQNSLNGTQITFDSTYNEAFINAGIKKEVLDASRKITFDGATFDHFGNGVNTNKSLAVAYPAQGSYKSSYFCLP